jgi:hypothetical protein
MKENKRKNNGCPVHGEHFLWREGDFIVCCIHECEWKSPARRQVDLTIPTVAEVRAKWS